MANTSHVSDQAHNAKECCKNLPAAFLGEDVKRDKSTVKRKSCSDFSLLALSLITPYASHMTNQALPSTPLRTELDGPFRQTQGMLF